MCGFSPQIVDQRVNHLVLSMQPIKERSDPFVTAVSQFREYVRLFDVVMPLQGTALATAQRTETFHVARQGQLGESWSETGRVGNRVADIFHQSRYRIDVA